MSTGRMMVKELYVGFLLLLLTFLYLSRLTQEADEALIKLKGAPVTKALKGKEVRHG
jgi:hypothetical protein